MTLAASEERSPGGVINQDGRIMDGLGTGQGKTLLFAPISASASGATQIVAANATQQIKVVSYVVIVSAGVSVKFQSGSTDLTGAMSFAANGGSVVLGQPSSHLFETVVNQALNINLGGAVQVSGHLSYFLE